MDTPSTTNVPNCIDIDHALDQTHHTYVYHSNRCPANCKIYGRLEKKLKRNSSKGCNALYLRTVVHHTPKHQLQKVVRTQEQQAKAHNL